MRHMQPCKLYCCHMKRLNKTKTDFVFFGATLHILQSNFNGSNIFVTTENSSRHGECESLRVNHGAR